MDIKFNWRGKLCLRWNFSRIKTAKFLLSTYTKGMQSLSSRLYWNWRGCASSQSSFLKINQAADNVRNRRHIQLNCNEISHPSNRNINTRNYVCLSAVFSILVHPHALATSSSVVWERDWKSCITIWTEDVQQWGREEMES